MPDHIESVPLDFPQAHKVADWEGVKHDLLWVIAAGKKYQSVAETMDFIILEALSAAIIVRYGRANVNGERRCIHPEMIRSLSLEQQQDHKFFKDLRNKFFAHSVNNFEENFCTAFFNNLHSSNPVFNQISAQHSRMVALSTQDILKVVSLSERLVEIIQGQLKIEIKKTAEIVRKMPIAELIKKATFSVQTRESAGKNRSRKIRLG